ncbi:TPA: thermonuclease family protein [Escherichia coli]|nr:thermonuclease family protein [Escherichia coli]
MRLYLLSLLILPGLLLAAEIQGKVVRVLDGDTIEVLQYNAPVRVRLANIDAPEKKQAYGRWSTNQLKTLVAGKEVKVTYENIDRYGRVLGVVETKHINVNRTMVIDGAAWVYDRYNTDTLIPDLQRDAQEKKRGLWADGNPVPPWIWRHTNKGNLLKDFERKMK